jgi:alpha-L-arabinofuranosidase
MKQLLVLLSTFLLLPGAVCHAREAHVRVDLSAAGKKVSPNQFGIFLEEINHAGDGGLYNELVRNGSFTEAATLDAWSAIRGKTASVNLFFDDSVPLSPAKPRSLRLEVESPNGDSAGVSNEGYWGIAVKQGESYEFSMYARGGERFDAPVTVTLEGTDGKVYGQTEISGLKAAWGRFSGVIQSTATDPAARLTISTKRSGTYWINMVSLRNGNDIFRADLVQKIKDLKPGFMRFPGGTYVQGNDRQSAFRWKTTIGSPETRAGHQDAPWSYWSTDHMGYHEYLLLCERVGAAPMYVAYAGMTWTPNSKSPFGVLQQHKIPVDDYPMDQMGPIVQETLDAIEYANGPATSKWGALRAKAGHPAPFGLKYVEIGNEDGNNPLYSERYMLFYKAIKAKYPEIQIIANARRGGNGQLPMDFVDEHSYARPLAAVDMGHRLDARDRKGPRAVLAEYAVQTSAGMGNMREALAEAVMLSGIERNSDIMPMASYAPMLANVHAINWRPDLIYFDGVSSYGTPSYYVQKMFADSRLDSVAPVEVNASEMTVRVNGSASAEGSNSQAEFQDEKVSGGGDHYTYSVRARKINGEGGFVVHFAKQQDGTPDLAWFIGVRHRASTLLVWGGGGNQDVAANQLESSFSGALAPAVAGSVDKDRWYEVKIEVEGRQVHCYLDGQEIHNVQLPESLGPSLYAEAGRAASGDIVVRLINTSPMKQNVWINLAGDQGGRYSATATQLNANDLDEENSLAEPAKISPRPYPQMSVGNEFQYDVEGNSFTVLKLTAERR